jgi:hypothetical protein
VKGLKVELVSATGQTLLGTEISNVPTYPTNGEFYPYTTLYRFETKNATRLEPEKQYTLRVTHPSDPSLSFEGKTTIPTTPTILSPDYIPAGIVPGTGEFTFQIPKVDADKGFTVTWDSNFKNNKLLAGYEVGAVLYYQNNGQNDTTSFLSGLFVNGDGVNCSPTEKTMCYQFSGKELIRAFRKDLTNSPGGSSYTYDDQPSTSVLSQLPKSLQLQVTATDSFFTKYLLVNSPAYQDFNSVKPEYTNLSGSKDVYGIFGSINKNTYKLSSNGYCVFGNCSEYLLGLNGTPQPVNCEL